MANVRPNVKHTSFVVVLCAHAPECNAPHSKLQSETWSPITRRPQQPMPLALPKSYSTGRVARIPTQPQTGGDHIRRRRLARKMLQREVCRADRRDRWESNTATPELRYMPAIICFLGYDPQPEANGWGERLVRRRTSLGLSQRAAAQHLGIDPATLARWERGEREPTGRFLARALRFVDPVEEVSVSAAVRTA